MKAASLPLAAFLLSREAHACDKSMVRLSAFFASRGHTVTALVKCKDCGWLGVRLKSTRELVDADEAYREEGYIARHNAGVGVEPVIESLPICYAGLRPFYEELRTPTPDEGRVKAALGRMLDECKGFTLRQTGISPKDLQEMKMLEEQRAWQAKQTQNQESWQSKESALNRRFQKWSISLNFFGLMAGPLLGVAAAWWISSPPKDKPQPPAPIVIPQSGTPATIENPPTVPIGGTGASDGIPLASPPVSQNESPAPATDARPMPDLLDLLP